MYNSSWQNAVPRRIYAFILPLALSGTGGVNNSSALQNKIRERQFPNLNLSKNMIKTLTLKQASSLTQQNF